MLFDNTLEFYCTVEEFKEIERLFRINIFNLDDATIKKIEYKYPKIYVYDYWESFEDLMIFPLISKIFPNLPYTHYLISDDGDSYTELYIGGSRPIKSDFEQIYRDHGVRPPSIRRESENKESKEFSPFEFGESTIIGNYEKKIKTEEICKTVQGLFHEVNLTKDKKLVGRGSNENDQLNISDMDKVIDVACGRLFTAILKENGKVTIRGKIGDYTKFAEDPLKVTVEEKTLFSDVVEKDEQVFAHLEKKKRMARRYSIYNQENILLGKLQYKGKFSLERLQFDLQYYNVFVSDVYTYTESRMFGGKPLLELKLKAKNKDKAIEQGYIYKDTIKWNDIVEIKSSYDGLIGIDKNNKKFFYGNINGMENENV